MLIDEIFESDLSLRRTIWCKRGNDITKRDVEKISSTDLRSRSRIEIVKDNPKNE